MVGDGQEAIERQAVLHREGNDCINCIVPPGRVPCCLEALADVITNGNDTFDDLNGIVPVETFPYEI